jgi:hypothetical protein
MKTRQRKNRDKLKKKLLTDIRVLLIFLPAAYFAWHNNIFIDETKYDNPMVGGACTVITMALGVYLLITWLFYDKFN